MRHRSKTSVQPIVGSRRHDLWSVLTCGNSSPQWFPGAPVDSGTIYTGRIELMSDIVTPKFVSRSRAGQVIFSPMAKCVTEITASGGGECEVRAVATTCSGSPNALQIRRKLTILSGLPAQEIFAKKFPPAADDGRPPRPVTTAVGAQELASAISQAATSCLAKRGMGDTNLSEALAESHKAIGLLPNILSSGLAAIRKNASALTRAKEAGSGYLAVRYGLMPIISDIDAVMKGLAKKTGRVRITSRGFANLSGQKTSVVSSQYFQGNLETTTTRSETYAIRAMSLDEADIGLMYNIGLTPKGLAGVPWELLPYSFVVDWFVNIGDLLYAMIPALGFNQLGSCYTLRQTVHESTTITGFTPSSAYTTVSAPHGTFTISQTYQERVLGLPSPRLVVKSDFRFDTLLRSLDALALIVQRLR